MLLKEVSLGTSKYYYLFYVTKSKPSKKYVRFLGDKKPSPLELDRAEKKFLEDIERGRIPLSKKNIISMLEEVQLREGYLPEKEMLRMSKELDIPSVEIYGVATFYSQFRLDKPAKYKVSVCDGTACHVKNSTEIRKYLEEMLMIKCGQSDSAGKFRLEVVNCLGACAKAPAMMINGKVYGELTKDKVKKIIGGLQ